MQGHKSARCARSTKVQRCGVQGCKGRCEGCEILQWVQGV